MLLEGNILRISQSAQSPDVDPIDYVICRLSKLASNREYIPVSFQNLAAAGQKEGSLTFYS